jgi:TonB family protein
MFDYAIGHYQKQPPSKRLLASWGVSIACHVAAVLILYLYPELLQSGRYLWFQQPVLAPPRVVAKPVRDLGVNVAMQFPPAEELKKYLPDWNRDKPKEAAVPPVHINLPQVTIDDIPSPLPKPRVEPPIPSAPPAPPKTLPAAAQPVLTPEEIATLAKKAAANQGAPPAGTPNQIPTGITNPLPLGSGKGSTAASNTSGQPGGGGTTGQDRRLSIEGFDSDAKGFNLQDYGVMIRELIKGRWEIPSNLREYQGSVTITFTILRNGTVIDARIFAGSGNNSLDMTALQAVWFFTSHPLPSLPPGFPSERLGARLAFAYNQRLP